MKMLNNGNRPQKQRRMTMGKRLDYFKRMILERLRKNPEYRKKLEHGKTMEHTNEAARIRKNEGDEKAEETVRKENLEEHRWMKEKKEQEGKTNAGAGTAKTSAGTAKTAAESAKRKKKKYKKSAKRNHESDTEDSIQDELLDEKMLSGGNYVKEMLEYEQVNEKPENWVIHELVNYGSTDGIESIAAAGDELRAASAVAAAGAASGNRTTGKAVQAATGRAVQVSLTASDLSDALEVARDGEAVQKIGEEIRQKVGYSELVELENPEWSEKHRQRRVIRRPVEELKLQTEEGIENQEPMEIEAPVMGRRPLSRRNPQDEET